MGLEYAKQCAELDKIARPEMVRQLPDLVSDPSARCLVCSKRPARSCAVCRSVAYCGVAHQHADARYHDVVCEALRDIAAPSQQQRESYRTTRPRTIAYVAEKLGVAAKNVHVMGASQREVEVTSWGVTLVGPELPQSAGVRASYSRALWSRFGTPDLVIGFNCGLMLYPSWKATILDLVGSGVPFAITSYRSFEADAEARLLAAVNAECLFGPEPNPFASLLAKRSSTIANDVSFDNAFVSAWR